jgi:hypothetical protein
MLWFYVPILKRIEKGAFRHVLRFIGDIRPRSKEAGNLSHNSPLRKTIWEEKRPALVTLIQGALHMGFTANLYLRLVGCQNNETIFAYAWYPNPVLRIWPIEVGEVNNILTKKS